MSRETISEISESDKQEYTAENQSDNALLFLFFLPSSFVKEKSTQLVVFYMPRLGSWEENLVELKGYSLFLCLCGLQCSRFQIPLCCCLK